MSNPVIKINRVEPRCFKDDELWQPVWEGPRDTEERAKQWAARMEEQLALGRELHNTRELEALQLRLGDKPYHLDSPTPARMARRIAELDAKIVELHGIPRTEDVLKIKALEARVTELEAACAEPMLVGTHLGPEGLSFDVQHAGVIALASSFYRTLGEAPNYVEMRVTAPDQTKLIVTIQRAAGHSPNDLRLQAVARGDMLQDRLERALAAIHGTDTSDCIEDLDAATEILEETSSEPPRSDETKLLELALTHAEAAWAAVEKERDQLRTQLEEACEAKFPGITERAQDGYFPPDLKGAHDKLAAQRTAIAVLVGGLNVLQQTHPAPWSAYARVGTPDLADVADANGEAVAVADTDHARSLVHHLNTAYQLVHQLPEDPSHTLPYNVWVGPKSSTLVAVREQHHAGMVEGETLEASFVSDGATASKIYEALRYGARERLAVVQEVDGPALFGGAPTADVYDHGDDVFPPKVQMLWQEVHVDGECFTLPGGWGWESELVDLPTAGKVVLFKAVEDDGDGYVWYDGYDRLKGCDDGVSENLRKTVIAANARGIAHLKAAYTAELTDA